MSFTRFVSTIYRLAPENPFNLPLPSPARHVRPSPRRAPVLALSAMPLDQQIGLILRYEVLGR